MNLIILDPGEVSAEGCARIAGPRVTHLKDVLAVSVGQTVRVGVLDGARGVAVVRSIGDETIDLRCVFEGAVPPRPRVDLLLAVPRPKVMRRLWAQIAALGVGRIILTNAERVERPYFDTHLLRPEIYQPLMIEGLQQARDTRLPTVSIHRRFKVLVEDELDGLFGDGLRLVADPAASARVNAVLNERIAPDHEPRLLLAIGPEGGWNDFELALLDAHGFHRLGMGPRTLRTDTACLALLTLVHDAISTAS